MNIGRIKRSIAGRCAAVLTVIMIVVMSLFDSLVYRPMEAYAAAVALPWDSGSFASVVSDLMGAFGGVFGKSLNSATTAIEFGDYVEGRRKEIIANPDATQEEIDAAMAKMFPFAYKDKAGNTKTVEVSGSDVVKTGEFINKLKSTAADTFEIPGSFVRVFQNFLVDKFNFSAVDGSAVSTVYTMPAAQYFDAALPRAGFPIKSMNDNFYVTADCTVWISSNYANSVYFVGPAGGHVYKNYTNGSITTLTFVDSTTGYSYIKTTFPVNDYNRRSESLSIPGWWSVPRPIVDVDKVSSYKFYIVNYEYATPSVDVSFADANAITWQGNPDLEQTLANQTQAATNGKRDEYVNNTITTANIDQALSYNALNYILDTIAGHYGVEVDSVTKDEFIASAYTDYVQGSSAEKMEQADEVMKKFVVINGTGGNNNKHFTVLDAVVSAYVTTLILKHILPEGTAAPEPETEVENIKIVQQLPKPTPDPDPGPNPDPNPNPDIDISLSGILSRLSKILDAILELPEKMVNAFKSGIESIINAITGLPEAITNSRLGQWVQSIPQSLQDILGQIKTIPDALIELGKGIAAVPGAIIDFFTIDMAQVSSAYSGMSDAFKGKFSALDQVIGVLDKDYNFSDTIPVIKMGTPDVLKYAIKDDEIVVMDLTPYANVFQWCRTILSAIMWIAFAHWVMDQFDVKFHVG